MSRSAIVRFLVVGLTVLGIVYVGTIVVALGWLAILVVPAALFAAGWVGAKADRIYRRQIQPRIGSI